MLLDKNTLPANDHAEVVGDGRRRRDVVMDYSKIAPMMGILWSPHRRRFQPVARAGQRADLRLHQRGQHRCRAPQGRYANLQTNHSHEMILRSGAFALNFPRAGQLEWIRDFGLRSGRDCQKLKGMEYSTG